MEPIDLDALAVLETGEEVTVRELVARVMLAEDISGPRASRYVTELVERGELARDGEMVSRS